jgi:hypothetical protein
MLRRTPPCPVVVALLVCLGAAQPAPTSGYRAALPALLRGPAPAPALAHALPRPAAVRARTNTARASLDLFEKDCVEFKMPPDMQAQYAPKTLALGAVVDADALLLQPLCVREEGSSEWYPDSRAEAITVPEDSIVRVMDTYPSQVHNVLMLRRWRSLTVQLLSCQRPIPSLGGGIGYGAEAVDCWEMQVQYAVLPWLQHARSTISRCGM